MVHQEFHSILESLSKLTSAQADQLQLALAAKIGADDQPVVPEDDLQKGLVAAGLLGEIKPLVADPSAYGRRRAVPIQGEPLSETVIRERR